jgi:DNA-binding HxlR family transcriptional regulator
MKDNRPTSPEIEKRLNELARIVSGKTCSSLEPGQERFFRYFLDMILRMGMKQDNPVVNLLGHAGNYWRSGLLLILQTGPSRPARLSDIFRVLNPSRRISRRILTMNLRLLERDGLVERHVVETSLKHVEYRLTTLGDRFTDHILSLVQWIGENADAVLSARAVFDAAEDRSTDARRAVGDCRAP